MNTVQAPALAAMRPAIPATSHVLLRVFGCGATLAHVEGLDERGARQREEELWMEFIRNSRVDGGFGMAYLRELQARK